jgi:hypothetical protein
MTERSEAKLLPSGVTKQPGWSIQRQSQDTSYILYSGEWYATVNSENAEKLLELLKADSLI